MKWLLCFLLPACTATYVRTPQWTVARISVLSNHQVPDLTITKDGEAVLRGYQSHPDAKSVESVTKGVVRAVLY